MGWPHRFGHQDRLLLSKYGGRPPHRNALRAALGGWYCGYHRPHMSRRSTAPDRAPNEATERCPSRSGHQRRTARPRALALCNDTGCRVAWRRPQTGAVTGPVRWWDSSSHQWCTSCVRCMPYGDGARPTSVRRKTVSRCSSTASARASNVLSRTGSGSRPQRAPRTWGFSKSP